MSCKPHQESEALFRAKVIRKYTEHNTMRHVPHPSGDFGHILRPVLQHVVHEIHATQEARVIRVRKTGRAATTPRLASKASCTAITGVVPCQGTPPLPIRAQDSCLALHTALLTASFGVVPCQGTPPLPIRAQDRCPALHVAFRGVSKRMIEGETNDHNMQGKRMVLNCIPE